MENKKSSTSYKIVFTCKRCLADIVVFDNLAGKTMADFARPYLSTFGSLETLLCVNCKINMSKWAEEEILRERDHQAKKIKNA